MKTDKEKLIEELKDELPWECEEFLEEIATFILSRDKKILEPLTELTPNDFSRANVIVKMAKAIRETLNRAGL